MTNIRIVTDSTGDIPSHVLQQWNIEIVPLKVHFGEEAYLDGVDITPDAFYKKLAESPMLPTTSQPSPNDFLEAYQNILKDNPEQKIISIHLSSAFSGTYQSAVMAKSMLGEQADITVIDSKSASFGIGSLAVAAAKAAAEGMSKEQCLALIHQLMEQTRLYFYVDTLEYLQKGGRIGKASALLGSLLQIKPILSIDKEGEVYPVDKVRGSKKAAMRIVELLKQDFQDKPVHIAIAHANASKDAETWQERLEKEFQVKSSIITEIGSVIGTHVGPGATGIFMMPIIDGGSQ